MTDVPLVEIRGVNFANKGAEMMLRAVLLNVEQRVPVRFGVNFVLGEKSNRQELGLEEVVWYPGRNPLRRAIYNGATRLLVRRVRSRLKLKTCSDVDVLLDCSGYAYGDPWGAEKTERAARYYARLKAQGARIVLLPQQLGPFDSLRVKDAFRRMLDSVDVVYARDGISYAEVSNLGDYGAQLKQAPDFTVGFPAQQPEEVNGLPDRFAIVVPNSQMLLKGGVSADDYEQLLSAAIGRFGANGIPSVLLLHELADGDRRIASRLRDRIGSSLSLVEEPDIRKLKGWLGAAHVTLGSRYHGLVSSLSQEVPSLGTGWSHKYQALFQDFNCPDLLLSSVRAGDELDKALDRVLDDAERSLIQAGLASGAHRYRQESDAMWANVASIIRDA